MKQIDKVKLMVMTALFAALTFIGTRINIPTGIGTHIVHVGDSVVYLAACILPRPYAMLASAIGAGFSDFTTPGCMMWVLPTMIIKPIMTLFFTSKGNRFCTLRNSLGVIGAGVTCVFGYYIAEVIITGNAIAPLAGIVPGLIQPIGSAIVFFVVALAFDGMKVKGKLQRQLEGNI